MFSPDELEALPKGAEDVFKALESRIMFDVIRRLKDNGGEITRSADWQIHRLYELGKSKAEIKKYIQDALELSDEAIDKIFGDAIESGYTHDKTLYQSTGKDFVPFKKNRGLQQLIGAVSEQTKSEFKNITNSLGFSEKTADGVKFTPLADFYQKTLDNAALDITSGAFDYNTVLKRTVKAMTDSGLRTVDYASGRSTRAEVAARRAVMTGTNQIVAKINEDNMETLEIEHVEVTRHGGARPSHQVWQGKVYRWKEKTKKDLTNDDESGIVNTKKQPNKRNRSKQGGFSMR